MDFAFENTIQEILRRINIIDIVGEHVKLKKSGSNFMGLCPFHNEKTPSFSVSPDKGLFYCFGCGVGGNVFTFLMKTRGITFSEALQYLSKRAGVALPKQNLSPLQRKYKELRNKIFQINKLAEEFYRKTLSGEEGRRAIEYLKNERGLSDTTISDFRLGYAPDRWNSLVNYLIAKGISLEDGEKAGLILPRKDGSYYDIFRDRVMFPITDMDGNIQGFGGRIIDNGEPKYLNSPETPVFTKGRTFYGMELTWKEVRKQEEAFIVEGYFDLIMLYEKGIKNVLAPLGTALTEEHVHLLRRIMKRAYMLFDSDSAGLRAAERVLPLFLDSGIDTFIILLPSGDDPDTFVRREGGGALLELKNKAKSLWDFYLDSMVNKAGPYPWRKSAILQEFLPLLNRITNSATLVQLRKQISERFGIDESVMNELIKKSKQGIKDEGVKITEKSLNRKEMSLIYVMLKYPEGVPKLKGYINKIEDYRLKTIAEYITDAYINYNNLSVHTLLINLEDEEKRNLITRILSEFEDILEPSSAIEHIVREFELREILDEEKRLTLELNEVQKRGDEKEIQHLLNLKSELIRRKQEFLKKENRR